MTNFSGPFKVIWQAMSVWWDDLINLLGLNLLLLLCWATIILGPPATFSMVQVSTDLVKGSSSTMKEMWTGVRGHLAKSWMWMGANILAGAVLAVNVVFYGSIDAVWAIYLRTFIYVVAVLWAMVQFYGLPFFVMQEDESLRLAWKNGLLLALSSPGHTVVYLVVTILVVVPSVFTVLPLLVAILPFLTILASRAVQERLETFNILDGPANDPGSDKDI